MKAHKMTKKGYDLVRVRRIRINPLKDQRIQVKKWFTRRACNIGVDFQYNFPKRKDEAVVLIQMDAPGRILKGSKSSERKRRQSLNVRR